MDTTSFDATELIGVRLSSDRKRLRLRLRDQKGKVMAASVPTDWLNMMLGVLPRQVESGPVHALDSWSMDRPGNGQDLVLTLRTPEGLAVSFAAKPWQVEGMATIATYGSSSPGRSKTVH